MSVSKSSKTRSTKPELKAARTVLEYATPAVKRKSKLDGVIKGTLFQTRYGKAWRFNLKGRNGEILCQSEAYTSKAKALNTMKAIIRAQILDYEIIYYDKQPEKASFLSLG